MPQLLTLSRAAHLTGISRATLQRRVRDGELSSFDGLVSTEDLVRLFPDIRLEDAGAFEKITGIRDDAFAKRLRERVLPSQEALAQRLFEQGQEMAELRRHLTRYHSLLDGIRQRIGQSPELPPSEIGRLIDTGIAELLASPAPPPAQQALDGLDAMLRVMSAHVTFKPSGREFFVRGSETLLDASLRAGLSPSYGCGNGKCGLCKARVIEGEVRQIAPADYAFSSQEKSQGYQLMCSCTAVSSDVVLEVLEAGAPEDIPEQKLMTKLRRIEPLTPGIIKLHLQTPRTNRLRFLAGQRVTLGCTGKGQGGDSHGEFPIASCPCDDRNLIFHIAANERRPASADFAARLFAGMIAVGDDISVWGPWGDFVLAKDEGVVVRPQIFAALDTGFAPVCSLIEHALAVETAEPMTLLRAASRAEDLYLDNQARAWADALDEFAYQPVIAADRNAGLAEALLALPALATSDIYLAGPGEDVDVIRSALLTAGIAANRLRYQGL